MQIRTPIAHEGPLTDPRAFVCVGVDHPQPAILTALPAQAHDAESRDLARDGGYLRFARTTHSHHICVSVLLVCTTALPTTPDDSMAASELRGAPVQMMLWPDPRPESRFMRQLSRITGLSVFALAQMAPLKRLELIEHTFATRSVQASVATDRFGVLSVDELYGSQDRVEPPSELASRRPAPPPVDWPQQPVVHVDALLERMQYIVTQRALVAFMQELRSCPDRRIGVDIECCFGPLGPPDDWNARDGSPRLIQLAGRATDGGWTVGVIDLWSVLDPTPIWELLGCDDWEKVIHHATFESQWLTYHYGVAPLRNVIDTRVASSILQQHWALHDPQYEAFDNKLGTVVGHLLGLEIDKSLGESLWGVEPLGDEQLTYAGLDAVVMLPLVERLLELARAIGCEAHIRAASAATCREASRRAPWYRGTSVRQAQELLTSLEQSASAQQVVRAHALLRALPLPYESRSTLERRLDACSTRQTSSSLAELFRAHQPLRQSARTGLEALP